MNNKLIYSGLGIATLYNINNIITPSVILNPIVGISIIGCGSLYGIYRIASKDKREHNRIIKDERERWNDFWKGTGVKNKIDEIPQLINIWETDNGKIYSFINPIGTSSKDYESREIAIKEFCGCNRVNFEVKENFLNIKTIETNLPNFVPFVLPKRESNELIIDLGINEEGKMVKINFSKVHSWLFAGATGSGKSVCIHNILTQLYCNYSDNTEFYICDMKKTELNNYRNLKNTVEYVDEVDKVEEIIDKLLEITDERHQLFIENNVKNLQQYNDKVRKNKRLPNIVLCIEECVRIVSNKQLQNKLAELGFIARSAGIILIMTIQRATKNLFSPDIKASLLGKIGFKTVNRINSQVIMDDTRLFEIKERGECVVSCDDISVGETNVKVMYLKEDKIDTILMKHCEYK